MWIQSFTTLGKFYLTTAARCSCPQQTYRQVECKHQRLAASIREYALAWSNRA